MKFRRLGSRMLVKEYVKGFYKVLGSIGLGIINNASLYLQVSLVLLTNPSHAVKIYLMISGL
jgi:hypothetical protein